MSNKYNYDELNKKIDKYLKANNYKISDLSRQIGISDATLLKTLNNKRDFYVNEMFKLINILKIDNKEINKVFFNQSI